MKFIIKYLLIQLLHFFYRLFFEKPKNRPIKRIIILYHVPVESNKNQVWSDGFTKAIELLYESIEYFEWINIAEREPNREELEKFDLVLVKSNWNWIPDLFARKVMKGANVKRGLLISGVAPPPNPFVQLFYDVVYYETFWYKKQLEWHPMAIHAFGIDKSKMYPENVVKKYDLLSIGSFVAHKRLEKMIGKIGKRAVIGDDVFEASSEIKKSLQDDGVTTLGFQNQDVLRKVINESKKVYVPSIVKGGGERALLEARSCGVAVEIERDNPKLKELISSPIWNEEYYACQLLYGIEKLEGKQCNRTGLLVSRPNLMASYPVTERGGLVIKGKGYVEIGANTELGRHVIFETELKKPMKCEVGNQISADKEQDLIGGDKLNHCVIVGSNVWIGDNVKFYSGVKVGSGAYIESYSVVTEDVPDSGIVKAGRETKKEFRYNDDIARYLNNLEWWKWGRLKVKENKAFFDLDLDKSTLENIIRVVECKTGK